MNVLRMVVTIGRAARSRFPYLAWTETRPSGNCFLMIATLRQGGPYDQQVIVHRGADVQQGVRDLTKTGF